MKINEEGNLDYTFRVKKIHLGRLSPGEIFWYKRKLWIVLNRVEGGGKLVRTLTGVHHQSNIQSPTSLVHHVLSGKKFK